MWRHIVERQPPAIPSLVTLEQLLSLGSFQPAAVQRDFVWDEGETRQLLADLDKIFAPLYSPPQEPDESAEAEAPRDEPPSPNGTAEAAAPAKSDSDFAFDDRAEPTDPASRRPPLPPLPSYHLGDIVLRPGSHDRYDIYDGLQRFTTLTILIAILRDLTEDTPLAQRLHKLIAAGDNGFRLHTVGRDTTLAENAQQFGSTTRRESARAYRDVGRRLLRVKRALMEPLRLWSLDRVDRFAEFLLDSVWFCVLHVHDARMARQIFVSTNLHGRRLDLVSLLKGQIGDLAKTEEELETVSTLWEEIREFSGQNHIETLRAFDSIERAEIQTDTWPTDLGAFLSEVPPVGGMTKWMGRFRSYAYGWKDCKRVLWNGGDSRIEQDVWRLHVFLWPEWHPLALRWWNQVHFAKRNNKFTGALKSDFERRFDWLHRRCMAITLARFSDADRQKIFANAMRQDKDGRNPLVNRGALTLSQSHRQKIDRTLRAQIVSEEIWAPLIKWLEIREWRPNLPHLMRTTNTEHLLPRNPAAESLREFNGDLEAYNNACFSLGNLAVVSTVANDRMRNWEYAQKLPTLRQEAGQFRTLSAVVTHEVWRAEQIAARADKLRAQIWEALKINPPLAE
jgi:hypothetical protein